MVLAFVFPKTASKNAIVTQGPVPMSPIAQASSTPEVQSTPRQVSRGSYMDLSAYESSDKTKFKRIILFFNAGWCATCKVLAQDIGINRDQIPTGTVIVGVDYDKNVDLRQKYRVLRQHTLVQVDGGGELLKKWELSETLNAVLNEAL
jgi:thiol-disulfide isomerase/thioredoxin